MFQSLSQFMDDLWMIYGWFMDDLWMISVFFFLKWYFWVKSGALDITKQQTNHQGVVLPKRLDVGGRATPKAQTFERELEPNTALIFSSAERLVNERPSGRCAFTFFCFWFLFGDLRGSPQYVCVYIYNYIYDHYLCIYIYTLDSRDKPLKGTSSPTGFVSCSSTYWLGNQSPGVGTGWWRKTFSAWRPVGHTVRNSAGFVAQLRTAGARGFALVPSCHGETHRCICQLALWLISSWISLVFPWLWKTSSDVWPPFLLRTH